MHHPSASIISNACFAGMRGVVSKSQCIKEVKKIHEESKQTLASLQESVTNLYTSLSDLLLTLRLAKPRTLESFTSLSDVINIHKYLIHSPSVGKNVRTDLVQEFVDIVDRSKTSAVSLGNQLSDLVKDLVVHVHVDDLLSAKKIREDFLIMTQMSYTFQKSKRAASIRAELNALDRSIFGPMVGYLPHLISAYKKVSNSVEHILVSLKTTQ